MAKFTVRAEIIPSISIPSVSSRDLLNSTCRPRFSARAVIMRFSIGRSFGEEESDRKHHFTALANLLSCSVREN